jgi:hypothetical protein
MMLARGDWSQVIAGPELEKTDPRSWNGMIL